MARAWTGGTGGRVGRVDRDDPDVMGEQADAAEQTGIGRRIAYGAAAFGGLFAAGWALSKTWGRKSGTGDLV